MVFGRKSSKRKLEEAGAELRRLEEEKEGLTLECANLKAGLEEANKNVKARNEETSSLRTKVAHEVKILEAKLEELEQLARDHLSFVVELQSNLQSLHSQCLDSLAQLQHKKPPTTIQ